MSDRFDVAIIGGGPAGASMASYIAQAGARCVVFERATFPRPHVGESLVPATNRVLREIGFLDQMDKLGFPRKYGAVWTTADGRYTSCHEWEGLEPDCYADIRFDESQEEGDLTHTWHVDRGKFDHALLLHAHGLGAEVRHDALVRSVELAADDSHQRLTVRTPRGEHTVDARYVVDASGRRTLLGRQLGLRVKDPIFNQFALHAWFEGYDRGDDEREGYIWIHFLPLTDTWVWQIPINDTVTSIGVVTQRSHFAGSSEERERFFWKCVHAREDLSDRLQHATQLGPLKEEGDYSYAMKRVAGRGWALVGDAARFVDPIFSSGVSVAVNSSRLAARDILAALQSSGTPTDTDFEAYTGALSRGTRNWYRFISLYYRLNILFTAFVNHPKHRPDVLRLLQGDVYDDESPPVLDAMAKVVRDVESNPAHPWHALLGTLRSPALG